MSDVFNRIAWAGLQRNRGAPANLTRATIPTGSMAVIPSQILSPYVANVVDFGATGDGTTDDYYAFRDAIESLAFTGGVLYIPPAISGTYLIGGCLRQKSNMVIQGSGAAATLKASPNFVPSPDYGGTSMWLNEHSQSNETHFTGYRDFNIVFQDLWIDMSLAPGQGAAHAIFNRAVQCVRILNCHFTAGGDGTASVTCDDHLVDGCTAIGQLNACYDHWGGSTNCRVVNSFAQVGAANNAQVVNFNGIRTGAGGGGSEVWVSDGFVLANCEIYGNATERSISLEPLGANTSMCKNIRIIGNRLYDVRIVMSGNTSDVAIIGNQFLGNAGNTPPIWARTQNALDADIVTVIGNQFRDCVVPATYGLIDTTAPGTSVIGNVETGCTYEYAVRFRNGVQGVFIGNQLDGASVRQVLGTWGNGQDVQVVNNARLALLDTAGVPAYLTVDAANTLYLVGTTGGGGPRSLFSVAMGSSVSSFQVFPNLISNGILREGSVETGITAAGTNAGDAYLLSKQINIVSTVASGTGVRLFSVSGSGVHIEVYNDGANNLTLYAAAAGTVNGGASVTVAPGASICLLSTNANTFRTAA